MEVSSFFIFLFFYFFSGLSYGKGEIVLMLPKLNMGSSCLSELGHSLQQENLTYFHVSVSKYVIIRKYCLEIYVRFHFVSLFL